MSLRIINREIYGDIDIVQNDTSSSAITFSMKKAPDGIDLSDFDFVALIDNGTETVTQPLTSEEDTEDDTRLTLTWIPMLPSTAVNGVATLQIVGALDEARWSTTAKRIVVRKSLVTDVDEGNDAFVISTEQLMALWDSTPAKDMEE